MHSLVIEAVSDIQRSGQTIRIHRRRSPVLDMEYDSRFARLNSFANALRCVEALPEVRERYGVEAAKNLVLQFVYAYLDVVPELALDASCFESIWSRFCRELSTLEWRHIGFTILQNFTSTLGRIEIADGVAVCLRTLEHAQGVLGQEELDWLQEDWMQGARGSHALLVEYREAKGPNNVHHGDAFHPVNKIHRALLALRLLKDGDVRTGRFFFLRPALLPTRLPGTHWSGSNSWRPGNEFQFDITNLPLLREYYSLLLNFDQSCHDSWKNIGIALRRFTSVYDSDWNQVEDQVVDAMIAIEALLGADQEITYKLSTRVAGILADSDEKRIEIYKTMKNYYDTRNKIVHGGELKENHRHLFADTSQLMNVVRRLLVAFLRLATESSQFNNRRTFREDIDMLLLHARDREKLRHAMGLV